MRLVVYWPIVYLVTAILYIMMILFLPFNQVKATVFLFLIVAFWSRIPGVGFPSPFYILYLADFIDFFALIVAVNLGGIYGVFFVIFGNIVSRACGVYPSWLGVIKDTIALSVACLVIPLIHSALGSDIFLSMIIFSVIRLLMFFPMRILPVETSFPQFLLEMLGAGTISIIINAFYASLFGTFFDSLLKKGMQFSWPLFIFCTIVILIAMGVFKKLSVRKAGVPISKKLRKIFTTKKNKKQKHILSHTPNIDKSRLEQIYPNDKDTGNMKKH